MTAWTMLLLLLVGHAIADYPLQGDFLSKAKNRAAPIPGVPWWQALGAHATIHGGVVGLITGAWWLGVAEAVVHAITDDAKCRGRISFNQDQAIHVACKVVWVLIAALLLTACATPKERVVYRTVTVPVFQPCAPKLDPKPDYPTLRAPVSADIFEQMRTLLVERDMRAAREMELEAAVSGCAAHPPDS